MNAAGLFPAIGNLTDKSTNQTMRHKITLTGIDAKTDLSSLVGLDAEFGILYTENPQGRNRYPSFNLIVTAARILPWTALHICGKPARQLLMEGRLPVENFDRIQVNGGILALEVEALCTLYPDHTIITQHNTHGTHLLSVVADNHSILIDASGGRGQSPNEWAQPETAKPTGFAGGLGPDNLREQIQVIRQIARPGWWVDMENKLRVDDWFCVKKAAECVTICNQ